MLQNLKFQSPDFRLSPSICYFQTGYLMIKKITIEDEEKTYELSYPNHEVRNSFFTYLLGEYTQKKSGFNTRLLKRGEFFGLSPDRRISLIPT
jgi:hypothetical protein